MPRYKVIVECSGPHGNAALTYRINAASQFAAEFRACQLAGDHYPEYRDIKPVRTEVLKNGYNHRPSFAGRNSLPDGRRAGRGRTGGAQAAPGAG
jgi:hypothetical protein